MPNLGTILMKKTMITFVSYLAHKDIHPLINPPNSHPFLLHYHFSLEEKDDSNEWTFQRKDNRKMHANSHAPLSIYSIFHAALKATQFRKINQKLNEI
jgi:hypothetical protein